MNPSGGRWRVGWAALVAAAGALAIVLVGWTWPSITRSRALAAARRAALAHDPPAVRAALATLAVGRGGEAEAGLLMAAACRRLGQASEARRYLEAAERAGAIRELADIERMLQDVRVTGLESDSARVLRFMLSKGHPESALLFEGLFDAAIGSFAMTEAHALVSEWIDRFPGDYYPRLLRGDLRARFHLGLQASAYYEAALVCDPASAAAAAGLGDVLVWQLGRAEEAEPILRGAIERDPTNVRALVALAEALRRTGRGADSLDAAGRVLAIAPDEPAAIRIVAAFDLEEGRPGAAIEALERAERARPGDLETAATLARALAAAGRPEEARAAQERVTRLREVAESLDPLLASILKNPSDVETRRRIGRAMHEMGRREDARRWLASADEIGARQRPDDPDGRETGPDPLPLDR